MKGIQSKYKGLLIDLDGTIIDSRKDIASSVNATLTQLGLKELPLDDIYKYIGNGAPVLMQRALTKSLGEDPSRMLEPGISLFMTHYGKHLLVETKCYPGVHKLLGELSDFNKVVITNKPKILSIDILKGLDILSHFTLVIGGDDVLKKKPDPEGVYKALEWMKLPPEEVIMVGDNYTDIESGHSAGVATCFCSYGMGELKSIEPQYRIDSFRGLKDILYQ
ncbi:MAG TPA: HAD family hydrolase [Spirochaetes bacterium]|nr:HAD family hydrolase [Spirochaetota bacterium]